MVIWKYLYWIKLNMCWLYSDLYMVNVENNYKNILFERKVYDNYVKNL